MSNSKLWATYTGAQLRVLANVATHAELEGEQVACLLDPARRDEALGMLDDCQARLGVYGDVLAPARAVLRDPPHTPRALLGDVLQSWQALNGLPVQCADEQRTSQGLGLSQAQREWLATFCNLWERTLED